MQSSDSGPIIIESSKGRVFSLEISAVNQVFCYLENIFQNELLNKLLARSIFLRRDSYLPVLEIKQHIQMSNASLHIFLPAVLMIRKTKKQ